MARFSMMQRSQTKRDPPSSSATHRNRTETEVEDGGHNTERLAGRTTVGTPLLQLGACFCPFPGSVATLELSIDGFGTGVACPPRSHQTAASGSARDSLRHARRGQSAACGAHAWPITEISSQSASIIHHTWSISRGDGEEGRRRAQHGTAQHSTAQHSTALPCLRGCQFLETPHDTLSFPAFQLWCGHSDVGPPRCPACPECPALRLPSAAPRNAQPTSRHPATTPGARITDHGPPWSAALHGPPWGVAWLKSGQLVGPPQPPARPHSQQHCRCYVTPAGSGLDFLISSTTIARGKGRRSSQPAQEWHRLDRARRRLPSLCVAVAPRCAALRRIALLWATPPPPTPHSRSQHDQDVA